MKLSEREIDDLIDLAMEAADAAAEVTLSYFRSDRLETANKARHGFDPVTRADRDAEAAMRAIIERARPQDGIIGEEHGNRTGTSGLTWVMDPIDGTRGFLAGTPTWGTLLSVGTDTGPLVGLIDQPYTGERFVGAPGRAFLRRNGDDRAIGVQPAKDLAASLLFTTFPEIGRPEERRAFERLAGHVRLTRYGMDCYAYALLAAGQIDLVVEAGLQVYDIHAPIAVIEAAGGIVTDWHGNKAHEGGQVLAASSPELHRSALRLLSGK